MLSSNISVKRLTRRTTEARSYLPPVQIGEVMRGTGVGRIIASKNPMYKPGDLASGICGWREIAILGPKEIFPPQLAPGQQLLPQLKVYDLVGVLSKQPDLSISNASLDIWCGRLTGLRLYRTHCVFRARKDWPAETWRAGGDLGSCRSDWFHRWANCQA